MKIHEFGEPGRGNIVIIPGECMPWELFSDAVNELSSVKCNVAMVPIGGTYTMNAKDAAKLINQIRPEVAIPTHYGSIVGKSEDADTFRKFVDQAIVVETRL